MQIGSSSPDETQLNQEEKMNLRTISGRLPVLI